MRSFVTTSAPRAAWVSHPLVRADPSDHFLNADLSRVDWLPRGETGTLTEGAKDRLDEAGVSRYDYNLHMTEHAHPHTATPHKYHAALGACLLDHPSLISAPRCTFPPEMRQDLGHNARPHADDREPRLERSRCTYAATFNERNNMPSAVSNIVVGNRVTPMAVHLDPTSQHAFSSTSAYIKPAGADALHQIWNRGSAVYEAYEWRPGKYRRVQVVAQARVIMNLAGVGAPLHHVEILMHIIENRNDSGMELLECSLPRSVSDAHIGPLRNQRRSDVASIAYFALASGDIICHNVVRSSKMDSDFDEASPGPREVAGGPSRQRPLGGSAAATSPLGFRQGNTSGMPRQQHDTGPAATTSRKGGRDSPTTRTTAALTPTSTMLRLPGQEQVGRPPDKGVQVRTASPSQVCLEV